MLKANIIQIQIHAFKKQTKLYTCILINIFAI